MNRLEDELFSALQYNQAVANEISETCYPFLKTLGISGFGYIKLFKNGKMLCISPNIPWTKHFFTQLLPEDAQQGLLREINEDKKYLLCANQLNHLEIPMYSTALHAFNMWYVFIIYERKHDHIKWCYFHGTKDSHNLLNTYINNIPILEGFISRFEKKFPEILDTRDEKKLFTLGNDPLDFSNRAILPADTVKEFLEHSSTDKFYISGKKHPVLISKRQAECLVCLLNGETAKETARSLGLSPRTVEFYLDNIKKRTDCRTKAELVSMFVESTLKGFTMRHLRLL